VLLSGRRIYRRVRTARAAAAAETTAPVDSVAALVGGHSEQREPGEQ
jgi:hypothetical protein